MLLRRAASRMLPVSAAITQALERASHSALPSVRPETSGQFVVRPDDLFIAAYPKSGATLLQMMLYQLTTNGEMDFPHIACVSPFLDDALRFGDDFESFPSPRLLKTHARRELLGDFVETGKWIYVVRHPGDVLVSAYFQMVLQMGREVQFTPFLEHAYTDIPPWGSWFDHTRSWWPHRDDRNVLLLSFRDLTNDLHTGIRRVAEFCDIPSDPARLRRVEKRCAISFMRRYDHKFDPRLTTSLRSPPTFIRKGANGSRGELSEGIKSRLRSDLTALFADLDGGGETLRSLIE